MKNKKGFTLVELLAVIVILALIMGIAVVSMSGVISSSRSKTYQETAAGVIHGLRNRLILDNKSQTAASYYVTEAILESGGEKSPYGNNYKWAESGSGKECTTAGAEYCAVSSPPACGASVKAYVTINDSGVYSICLSDGTHYLNNATEADLLETKATVN